MTVRSRVHAASFPASRCPAAIAAALALLAILALGCGAKPPCNQGDAKGCIITKLRLVQDRPKDAPAQVDADDVTARLATADSSRLVTTSIVNLFGENGTLFFRYERFDRLVLERDLERVERYYRSRGYYEARVRAGRVMLTGPSTVQVEVVVDEGLPVTIQKVELELIDPTKPLPTDPPELGPAVTDAKNTLEVDARFEEEGYERAKRKTLRVMTDRGYAYAKVVGRVSIDLATHHAIVTLAVEAGPKCTFGPVTMEGLGDLPEAPMRAAIRVRPGRRFSTEVLDDAQTTLGDFGVLSSVSIDVVRSPEGEAPNPVVPIRITVQPASLRTIQLGGGGELGSRVQAHLISSWEHKNFLGGLRRFSVGGRGGIVFYPLQLTDWSHKVRLLPDIRTHVELTQPAFLEPRTNALFRVELNLYRPETADSNASAGADVDTKPLFENLEARATVGLDRPFFRSRLRLGTTLSTQYIEPLAVYGDKPPGFERLFLPIIELRGALDLRRNKDGKPDAINPHSGVYIGAIAQGAAIVPDNGWDVRLQPELRGYIPISENVTLAFRAAAGFLFPFNYGELLFDPPATCDEQCQLRRSRALQIMQLRGFYSGGPTSNRGYGYNGVNPQEEVVLNPGENPVLTPIGGRNMWNASLELRFPIYGDFGAGLFADTSDVWNDAPVGPHLSAGFGLRYATPIGPARIELAVRIPCAQRFQQPAGLNPCKETPEEDGGPSQPLDLPIGLSFGIGEAF